MPLRKLIDQSMLSPEDADLLESLLNQFSSVNESAETRYERASRLVEMFVAGEQDQRRLAGFLAGKTAPEAHSMVGTSPD